jgi:hypothetical protein
MPRRNAPLTAARAVCVPGTLHGRVSTLDACRYPPGITEIGGLHSEGALRFGTNSCYRWVLWSVPAFTTNTTGIVIPGRGAGS